MTAAGVTQILVFSDAIVACARPMGAFMARLFDGRRTFLHPILRPLERAIYALGGIREDVEQRWTAYAGALMAFSVAKFVFTYAIQRLQGVLPLNPQGFSTAAAPAGATAMTPDLAFNTAVSFVTNTNWQSYVGETTVSYFVQMVGADGPELHLRRRRHRHRHRPDPRLLAPGLGDNSAISGST